MQSVAACAVKPPCTNIGSAGSKSMVDHNTLHAGHVNMLQADLLDPG